MRTQSPARVNEPRRWRSWLLIPCTSLITQTRRRDQRRTRRNPSERCSNSLKTPPVTTRGCLPRSCTKSSPGCGEALGITWALLPFLYAQTSLEQRIPRQEYPAVGAVHGVIRQQQAGLGGARVVLAGASSEREVFTTGDGAFLFLGLTPGAYRLNAFMDGFSAAAPKDLEVAAGATVAVEVLLVPLAGPTTQEIHAVPPAEPYHQLFPQPATTDPEPTSAELAADDRQVFVPLKNRWNYLFPDFHRYDIPGEYQYTEGRWYDPFNQNRLKGDYPLFGGRTFLNFSMISGTAMAGRSLPLPPLSGPPPSSGLGQFAMSQNFTFSGDLFGGDAAFRPVDWRVRFTPVVNVNYTAAS